MSEQSAEQRAEMELAELIAQRDELLSALMDMTSWVAAFAYGKGQNAYDEVMRSPRMAKARSAIARCEGKE